MIENPRNKADEATIIAAREYIAFLEEGYRAAHAELDKAGIERESVEWEGVIQHVTEYPVCDRIRFLAERIVAAPADLTSEVEAEKGTEC